MRATQFYAPTLRQAPGDAELPSHRLLLRGGFIRPLGSGTYTFLPLGLRALRNIERIVREEMDRAGALEIHMPVLQPRELWERTGRWDDFQPTPLRVKDRAGRWFCLGPTHEENVTDLVAADITSYRELPLTLYQIQTKFRDEMRPRGGLIRVKEFLMKDAYSFDTSMEGLDKSYIAMFDAYVRIFARLQLDVVIVEADAGSMGGFGTREFTLLCEHGEDTVFMCSSCDYRANLECATARRPLPPAALPERETAGPTLVETPDMKTVEQVCAFLKVGPEKLIKTLLVKADDRFYAALVRGDREMNEIKLSRAIDAKELRMALPEEVEKLTGAPVGFSGPVGLSSTVTIIADNEVVTMSDFVVGANKADAHLVGVNLDVDFKVAQFADLRRAEAGDHCPCCDEGELVAHRGIEIGHVFKLGTKYSVDLDANYLDEHGEQHPIIMGCYGFGVSRCLAALVEANHDDNGIVWPLAAAPFQVAVLLLDPQIPELAATAETVVAELEGAGYSVLLDDRDQRPGVKFKDADLIGYPMRVVVGKKAAEAGNIEVKRRRDGEERIVPIAEAVNAVAELASG